MELHVRKPTPALAISTVALFVALGGAGWAATNGTFILGKSNSATSPTTLVAPIAGNALQLSNTSTAAGASALRLDVASGHAPLRVNAGAGTVPYLDADKLDGLQASS